MVENFQILNHTEYLSVFWSDMPDDDTNFLCNTSRIRMKQVESYMDFSQRLSSAFCAMLFGSVTGSIRQDIRNSFYAELHHWTSNGNLLVINDITFISEDLKSALGIDDICQDFLAINNSYEITINRNTPVTYGINSKIIKALEQPSGFTFARGKERLVIAEGLTTTDKKSVPIAFLTPLGNGFCLVLGFEIDSLSSTVRKQFVNAILMNTMK